MEKLQEIQNTLTAKFEALSKGQPPHIEAGVAAAGGALQGALRFVHAAPTRRRRHTTGTPEPGVYISSARCGPPPARGAHRRGGTDRATMIRPYLRPTRQRRDTGMPRYHCRVRLHRTATHSIVLQIGTSPNGDRDVTLTGSWRRWAIPLRPVRPDDNVHGRIRHW